MKKLFYFIILLCFAFSTNAQIQFSRENSLNGRNTFEPTKDDDTPFEGFKLQIGAGFTQDLQMLTSENKANYQATSGTNKLNKNILYGSIVTQDSLKSTLSGFNTAEANLSFNVQLADGIRVLLENYMSARHHNEFWVKGGYIQIDKLSMFGNPDWFNKYLRVKIGHFQPNYGDFGFRRSDGGNTIFNPFTENLILDAFTTEIGGEVYVFPTKNIMVLGGASAGFINGNIAVQPDAINNYKVVPTKRTPSLFGKVAYDNHGESLRYRLSASVYYNSNIQRNTLFAGDRTGSHYFGVMEPATIGGLPISIGTSPTNTATQAGPNFTSGRFDPGMSNKVTAINISPFVKFGGLEVQGGIDLISGGVYGDTLTEGGKLKWGSRAWTQFYGEAVYRLFNDAVYVGARYVQASGEPSGLKYSDKDSGKTAGTQAKVNINRLAFVAGYAPVKNLLLKLEYVTQQYKDFPWKDYRNEGKFSGLMVEAVVGF